jgi:hypothetical protein
MIITQIADLETATYVHNNKRIRHIKQMMIATQGEIVVE